MAAIDVPQHDSLCVGLEPLKTICLTSRLKRRQGNYLEQNSKLWQRRPVGTVACRGDYQTRSSTVRIHPRDIPLPNGFTISTPLPVTPKQTSIGKRCGCPFCE